MMIFIENMKIARCSERLVDCNSLLSFLCASGVYAQG